LEECPSPTNHKPASRLEVKKIPGRVSATREDFARSRAVAYRAVSIEIASTIALKDAQGRIAFDVLTGSGS